MQVPSIDIGARLPAVFETRPCTNAVDVIESGIDTLDRLLPSGGLIRGKLSEISGCRSCGKRTLAAAFCASVLESGRNAAWIDARESVSLSQGQRPRHEGAFYPLPMLERGYALERLLVVRAAGLHPPNRQRRPALTGEGQARSPRNKPRPSVYGALRAADILLQNGGATVLTVIDLPCYPDAQLAKQLARLHRGAEKSGTAVLFISEHDRPRGSLGTFIALHLVVQRAAPSQVRIAISKSKHGNMAHHGNVVLELPFQP